MPVRHSFKIDYPEGYQPVVRPKEWNRNKNSYGEKPPSFRFEKKEIPANVDPLAWITSQIADSLTVANVCTQQMAKYASSEFILELGTESVKAVERMYAPTPPNFAYPCTSVEIWSSDLKLFQRNMKYSPKS